MKHFALTALILVSIMLALFISVPATADGNCDYYARYSYGDKTYYVNTGNAVVAISDILQELDLSGVVSSVQTFDETYVSVTEIDNDWNLQVLRSFTVPGNITCTIEGQSYQIQVVGLPNSISVIFTGTLYFDKSGGTGNMTITYNGKTYTDKVERIQINTSYTLPENAYTPPADCIFAGWEIQGITYQPGDSYYFSGSTTAKALWKNAAGEITNPSTQYAITVDCGSNGTIEVPSTASEGTVVSFTAHPNAGYAIGSYSINGVASRYVKAEQNTYTFNMPSKDTSITATFVKTLDGGSAASPVQINNTDVYVLTGGYYKVNSNITFNHRIFLAGNVHLILESGTLKMEHKTMDNSIVDGLLYGPDCNLTVSGSNGKLHVITEYLQGIYVKNLTMTGGTIEVDNSNYLAIYASNINISGGTVMCKYNYGEMRSTESTYISGGKVSVTTLYSNKSVSITGGQIDVSNTLYGYPITLSCSNNNDYIYINQFNNNVTIPDSVVLKGAANDTYSGTFTKSAANEQIARKRLVLSSDTRYTITYNANGGTGTMPAQKASGTATLTASTFSHTGYRFTGWNTEAGGGGTPYGDESSITLAVNIELFAQWEIMEYTIKWMNNGVLLDTNTAKYGTTPSYAGENPTKAEDEDYTYTFKGWYPTPSAAVKNVTYSAMFTPVPKHTHVFTFSATGAVITASCANTDGKCRLTGNKVTLTIDAPTLTTYSSAGSASATLTGLSDFNTATGLSVAESSIRYAGREGTTYDETGTAPMNAGKYTARITVEEKTAKIDYEIEKAMPTYTVPSGLTAFFGQILSDVSFGSNTGWTWEEPSASVGDVGTHIFKASYTPPDPTNYQVVSNIDVGVTVIPRSVAIPSAATGLKWTGQEQTGVAAGEGYTVTNGTGTAAGNYTAIAALISTTNYQWNDGTSADKEIQWSISKADGPAAPAGLYGIAPTTEGGGDGKITGVTTDMEYSLKNDFSTKNDCTGSEITGLSAGTYYVRLKETATHAPGAYATVMVPEYGGTTYAVTVNNGTGTGSYIAGANVTITANAPEAGIQFRKWIGTEGLTFVSGSAATATAVFTMPARSLEITATYENKPDPIVTPPTAKTGLVYTGEPQELLNPGSAEGGEMLYSLGAAPGEWGQTVPTGTAPGNYFTWYRVIGDENHNDTEAVCIPVRIERDGEYNPVLLIEYKYTDGTKAAESYENNIAPGSVYSVLSPEIPGFTPDKPEVTGTMGDEDVTIVVTYFPDSSEKIDISKATISAIKDQTYTGKAVKPKLNVKLNGKTMALNIDYTVIYSSNKKIGTATVTLTGVGKYTGTKTASFRIIPKKVTLSRLKRKGNTLTVKWRKGKGIDGYEIEYSLKKSFKGSKKITIKKAKTTSYVIKKLKAKKTYYIRIRAWKKVKGKKYYSEWSKVRKKKIQ